MVLRIITGPVSKSKKLSMKHIKALILSASPVAWVEHPISRRGHNVELPEALDQITLLIRRREQVG